MQQEYIVYVDEQGKPTGETAPKLEAHHADTKLHLAFSCYVFNNHGEFLVTRRADTKKVWPGVWTNSVCGHPGPDEEITTAIQRRLHFELGMQARDFAVLLPDYIYQTPPFNGIIEHEFCPVYIARATSRPTPNPEEVSDYKWMSWEAYVAEAEADTADKYSWWCKDQLGRIKSNPLISQYAQPVAPVEVNTGA